MAKKRNFKNTKDDFFKRFVKTDSCWVWQGKLSLGYGDFCMDGRCQKAHRWAYEFAKGPIPKGMHIDHLCRNRACVNPDHLEVVTPQANTLRGIGLPAQNAAKTHCYNGHEFTPENTRQRKTGRACIVCTKQYRRDYRELNRDRMREADRKYRKSRALLTDKEE